MHNIGLMVTDINTEKIVAGLGKSVAKSIAKSIYDVGSNQYEKVLVIYEICFNKYLNRVFNKYSKIKTLLYRDRPVDFDKHYVPTDFQIDNDKTISENELFEGLDKYRRLVVSGSAGSGKSLFLRSILLRMIRVNAGKVPVFIELRYLNQNEKDSSIFDFIYKLLHDINSDFTVSQLEYSLRSGKVTLLLDGFDELDHARRSIYEKEILEISYKYPETGIILTSRPDDVFSSWDEYATFKVKPLDQKKAILLIKKIDYEDVIKNKFIKKLSNDEFFELHESFLSNPLLITMMLLTYEQLAEIPDKLHIFYEQAFDTLFHKHDALKALYKRKSYSSLPIDEFKSLFSTFCVLSYSDKKYSFSKELLIDYINKAKTIEGFDVEPNLFFNDLIKTVCVMQRDGDRYIFSHRSFQEYFSALFISRTQSADVGEVLDKVALMRTEDKMLIMLFDMNRELVERKWVLPKLRNFLDKLSVIDIEKHAFEYMSVLLSKAVSIGGGDVHYVLDPDSADSNFFVWVAMLYKNEHSLSPYTESCIKSEQTIELIREKYIGLKSKDKSSKEIKSLSEVNYDYYFRDLKELDGSEWVKETIIFDFCQEFDRFSKSLLIRLEEKYKNREISLSDMLLKKDS